MHQPFESSGAAVFAEHDGGDGRHDEYAEKQSTFWWQLSGW